MEVGLQRERVMSLLPVGLAGRLWATSAGPCGLQPAGLESLQRAVCEPGAYWWKWGGVQNIGPRAGINIAG